jgi:tRNA-binding protein
LKKRSKKLLIAERAAQDDHPTANKSFLVLFFKKELLPSFWCTMADIDDFEKLDIRVGTITDAKPFPEARRPAIRLWIDFGEDLGTLQSSAQITVHYRPDQLIGRQVCAVVNLPPRQIGPMISEALTLGLPDENGEVVLLRPDFHVPNGGAVY